MPLARLVRFVPSLFFAPVLPIVLAAATSPSHAQTNVPVPTPVAKVEPIVAGLLRDDYRGDLAGLARGFAALEPFVDDAGLRDAVRYWRGFARWRGALNRMNEPGFERGIAIDELLDGVESFRSVGEGAFSADAKSAAAGSLMSVQYLRGQGDPGTSESKDRLCLVQSLLKEAVAAGPENPRVLWILGGQQLWTPKEFGGDRARALATYERALTLARAEAARASEPLAPRWGEPELLMTLAYAYANFEPLDLARAETLAREALALQPEWKYVKTTLLPDIRAKIEAR